MPLTEGQKADVRRHLGYGPLGNPAIVGATFISYRFFTIHGLLEFRLQALSVDEEKILVGPGVFPKLTDQNTGTLYEGYVNICNFLESQIAESTDNLDTEKAGDWTASKKEINNRQKLYHFWTKKMSQFMYVPLSPTAFGESSNIMQA